MSVAAYRAARYRAYWDERLHPRDLDGKFAKKWIEGALPEIPEGVTLEGDPQFAPVKWHLQGLAQIPKETMDILREHGVTWVVGDKGYAELDSNQDRMNEHPSGWGDKTFKDIRAAYDKRRKQVTLGAGLGGDPEHKDWAAMHETGHAVDGMLEAWRDPIVEEAQADLVERYKELTRQRKSIIARTQSGDRSAIPELVKINSGTWPWLPYYIQAPVYAPNQPSLRGREEMIASGLMYHWAGARPKGEEMFGAAFMDYIETLDGKLKRIYRPELRPSDLKEKRARLQAARAG